MLMDIPIGLLEADPENVRRAAAGEAADAQLRASVEALGVLQPLLVRPIGGARYRVVAGHRRLAAAAAAGLADVPCKVLESDDEAFHTVAQITENTVRSDMAPADLWCAFEKLSFQGMGDDVIAATMGLPARVVQRFRLCARLPEPMLEYIRATGNLPDRGELRDIAYAGDRERESAWRLHGPKKPGDEVYWHQVAHVCRAAEAPLSNAVFERTPENLMAVEHYHDLFAEPGHEGYCRDVAAFMKLQAEACMAQRDECRKLGFARLEVMAGDAAEDVPAGCERYSYQRFANLGAAKASKKAERKRYVLAWHIRPLSGSVALRAHLVKQQPAKAQPASGAGAEPAAAREKDDKARLTHAGVEAVEKAKRDAAAGALRGLLHHMDMLAIALVLLRQTSRCPADMSALFDDNGELRINDDDRRKCIEDAFLRLVVPILSRPGRSEFVPLALVERIGHALNAVPVWNATRADLDALKRPAVEAVRRRLGVSDYPTQKAVKDGIMRTRPEGWKGETDATVRLEPGDLPELAYVPSAELPSGWRANEAPDYSILDDDDGQPGDEGDGDALASAGFGTDEDYGGDREAA